MWIYRHSSSSWLQVYISLLKNGRSSGYKIAKEISLSRSSVY
ncbi:helix-turn-helix domain-containing protein, partial [Escherichia coli]